MISNFKNIKKTNMVLFLIVSLGMHVGYASPLTYSNLSLQPIRWSFETLNNRIEGQQLIDQGIFDIERGRLKQGQKEIAEGQALKDLSHYEDHGEWHHDWRYHWHHWPHRW